MHVVAVDIGIRNFAYTLYCTERKEFLLFRIIDLGKVKDYVVKMEELSVSEPFCSCDVLLVENQMRSAMRTMATALRCFNMEKAVCVAPQSVKRHFKSSMRSHYKNKKTAKVIARQFLSAERRTQYDGLSKKDDIADCVLMTIWHLRKEQKGKKTKNA
jgi:hypothetical protein